MSAYPRNRRCRSLSQPVDIWQRAVVFCQRVTDRPRHPKKEVEEALDFAETHGVAG